MHESDSYGESEAERRHHVERAFAAVERRGSVVSPFARIIYKRYINGELTFSQVQHEMDVHAAETIARACAAFGWVGKRQE